MFVAGPMKNDGPSRMPWVERARGTDRRIGRRRLQRRRDALGRRVGEDSRPVRGAVARGGLHRPHGLRRSDRRPLQLRFSEPVPIRPDGDRPGCLLQRDLVSPDRIHRDDLALRRPAIGRGRLWAAHACAGRACPVRRDPRRGLPPMESVALTARDLPVAFAANIPSVGVSGRRLFVRHGAAPGEKRRRMAAPYPKTTVNEIKSNPRPQMTRATESGKWRPAPNESLMTSG